MGQAASCLRLMMMMMSWGGDDTVGVTLVDGVEAGLVLELESIHFQIELSECVETSSQQV